MVHFRDVFDVTTKEKKIILEKAARRIELRNEYLKKFHTPYKPVGGLLFDEPIQRLMSLRNTRIYFNKPTFLGWLLNVGTIFVPMGLLIWLVKWERDIKDHQLRTGQIAYKDRFNKFV